MMGFVTILVARHNVVIILFWWNIFLSLSTYVVTH